MRCVVFWLSLCLICILSACSAGKTASVASSTPLDVPDVCRGASFVFEML